MSTKHAFDRGAACMRGLLVLTLATASAVAQNSEGRYRACAEAGRTGTPSSVPYDLVYQVVNTPVPGGPVQLNIVVTASMDLARVSLAFTTDGSAMLASSIDQSLMGLVAGVPTAIAATLNVGLGGTGGLYANTRWFELTACGEEPREAEEFPFFVLDDGISVFTGGQSLIELQMLRLEALVLSAGLTEAAAALEGDVLLGGVLETGSGAKSVVEGGAPSTVGISGTANWTDSAGGIHACRNVILKAYIPGPMGTLTEVASTTASASGTFSFSLATASLGASPRDITVRVLSDNFSTRVRNPTMLMTPTMGVYFFAKTYAGTADGAVISGEVLTGDNVTTAGRSFSVADSMVTGNLYVQAVDGSTPAKLDTFYPHNSGGTASFFSPGSVTMNIHTSKPFMWDVLLHEYGHYLAHLFNLDQNPGGSHACNEDLVASKGKGPGARLAWGEGLATYLGIAAQLVTNAAALAVPFAGDTSYHSNSATTGAAWQYDNEARDLCIGVGEGVETNVSRCLLDVADSAIDGDDRVAKGHTSVWTTLKGAAADANLSDAWNALVLGKTVGETIDFGAVFAQNAVSPRQTSPVDGAVIAPAPPVFKWDKHKLNEFRVKFYSEAFAPLGGSADLGDVAEWTPTQMEWDAIRNAATTGVILWVVEGENTTAPMTGTYWSGSRRLGGVDFAFVIDDTGSMSEEIGGVRNALLAFLSTFDPMSTAVRFQLTTFKDNVTVRASTTSLATISADVSALFATGGSDCPEESVGGLSQGTTAMKNGGTVLFATDADPRPGSDLNALIADLRARGARVNVLLSGTCSGFLNGDPRQDEDGPTFMTEGGTPEGIGFTGAVDAYTQIASATDGAFVYLPEVNFTSAGAMQYQAAAENILAAALGPKVVVATPNQVPQGGTATLLVEAQNTNFLTGTTLSLGAGVTVLSISVVDSVTLSATVMVDAMASTGFRDATATTMINSSTTEVATGASIIEITVAPGGPALLSASPAALLPGVTTDVVISGLNTNFLDMTSTSSFGPGVTVNSTVVSSPTTATANITVDPGAAIGFRTVGVTTMSEFVSSPPDGFFRVDASSLPVPIVTSVVPDNASAATVLQVQLMVANTVLDGGGTTVEFSGAGVSASGVTVCGNTIVATVTVLSDALNGFRDVIVRSGGGTAVALGAFFVGEGVSTTSSDDDDCGACRVGPRSDVRWSGFAALLALIVAASIAARRASRRPA